MKEESVSLHEKTYMKKCKLLILIAMLLLILTGCGKSKPEINLTEFVSVSFTGINGKAETNVRFDFPSFEESLIATAESEDISVMQLAVLEESIKLEADKTENITNGDTITVSLTWNDELVENIGVKFTGSEITIEAADIEEGKVIDPFQGIVIEYSGTAPYAKASVNKDLSALPNDISYKIENADNYITNGDEIKVTAYYNADMLETRGYIVTETEHTFIAEGIDYYITEYTEIDEETFQKMDDQARDMIESKLADNYEYRHIMYPKDFIGSSIKTGEISNVELTNTYFLVLKELGKDSFSTSNLLYQIYKVTTIDEKSPEGKIVYVPVIFKNFIMKSTGVDVDFSDAYVQTQTYEVFDDMFREKITANKDKYTYEEITY